MHAATVEAFGQPPVYAETPDLPPPPPGQLRLKILAAAVHRLVQLRASGKHYSARTTPVDPSSDGVGIDEATGQRYYIGTFAAPVFAEYANVDQARLVPLDAADDAVAVAALTNPVSSAWMPLQYRVSDLPTAFSLLVVGVTGTSGRTAIPVARHFGAGRIIGAARNESALRALQAEGSIDAYIVLGSDTAKLSADVAALGHVDVVLDYVYGAPAATVLDALVTTDADARETQYVNVGAMSGDETLPLHAQTLRSKRLRLAGTGPGSYRMADLQAAMPGMVQLAGSLPKPADVVPYSLDKITDVWDTDEARTKRIVLLPGE